MEKKENSIPLCPLNMSKIKQKSEFNISASEELLRMTYYAPSVHCSYYSCFQLLKYTINVFFGVDYNTQAVNTSAAGQKTHQYVLNYITRELNKLVSLKESRDFKKKYKDLKQFRIDSDYENIEIDSEKGFSALRKAKEIRTYVIQNFNL